jgi:hypothetical protein
MDKLAFSKEVTKKIVINLSKKVSKMSYSILSKI